MTGTGLGDPGRTRLTVRTRKSLRGVAGLPCYEERVHLWTPAAAVLFALLAFLIVAVLARLGHVMDPARVIRAWIIVCLILILITLTPFVEDDDVEARGVIFFFLLLHVIALAIGLKLDLHPVIALAALITAATAYADWRDCR